MSVNLSWLNRAIELREQGMSYNNIAKELKKDKRTVSYYLKEAGYGPNEKYQRFNQKQPNKKYVNENYFEVIDTEHKAYWLGFLYADGCVSTDRYTVDLGLKEDDYEHLLKFKEDIESEHNISKRKKEMNGKVFYSYRLSIDREKLKNDLIDKGCYPNKTKILAYPTIDQVPLHLQHHFIRGYFDGDGCITSINNSKNIKIEIIGTNEFLNGLVTYFGLNENQNIYTFNHTDVKRFSKSGYFAFNIMNILYRDATIYLDRKYQRFLEYLPFYSDNE